MFHMEKFQTTAIGNPEIKSRRNRQEQTETDRNRQEQTGTDRNRQE